MIVNESDGARRERLAQYRVCQQRGHKATSGLGEMLICEYCGVWYQFVLQEECSSLPTGINRPIPEIGAVEWVEMALPSIMEGGA